MRGWTLARSTGRCRTTRLTVPHGTTHAKLAGIAPQNEHLGLKAGRAGSTLTAVRSNVAGPAVPLAVGDTVLVVQSTASTGERKTYRVTVTREAQAAVAVSLSATPNPVDEGAAVTVRATLATALVQAVTIPLTVTRGTSEDGDHGSLSFDHDSRRRHVRHGHGIDGR